jgi:hypothetical protein
MMQNIKTATGTWLNGQTILTAACGIAALFILSLVSQVNYLFFHSIVEIATIVGGIMIVVIVWNLRDRIDNAYFLVIGIGFFFIIVIDFVHTLSFKGMGVFPGITADLPTQLWIAGRYLQAFILLAAPLMIGRKVRIVPLISVYAIATALLVGSISAGIFPHCFIDGQGLTPFKIASEYAISGILVVATFLLYQKRSAFDPHVFRLLVLANVCTIGAELAFTAYVSVFGFANMIGHLVRLISTYCTYAAVVIIGLKDPGALLWRNLVESEERFRTLAEYTYDWEYLVGLD